MEANQDNALEIKDIVKKYNHHTAVNHISLNVKKGSIFGLLGPNGAGKTTLLRIVTGIILPDSGEVIINGQKTDLVNNAKFIGYMPEERGLYKKMKVDEQAIYLAQLKDLSYSEAKKQAQYWFDKLQMNDWKGKKVEDISKGMAQKLQFVCTVIHNPNIIILDEPFSGLDPLNADIIKQEIFNLAQQGASIIFSTHRMEQVEEICDEIALINKGQVILNDTVSRAKSKFFQSEYTITGSGLKSMESIPELYEILSNSDTQSTLKLAQGVNSKDVLKRIIENPSIEIETYNPQTKSLNDIFIELVNQHEK